MPSVFGKAWGSRQGYVMGQHDVYDGGVDEAVVVDEYDQGGGEAVYPVETGGPADSATASPAGVAVWVAVGKLLLGLVGMVAVLACSEGMVGFVQRWGYVPVMLVYMLAMMLTGGLVAAGAMGLWSVMRGEK